MSKHVKKISIALSIGLISMVQITPATAGKQIYPASSCVPWNSFQPTPLLNASRIYNTSSTKELHVDCPILHQNFSTPWGNNLDDADIGIIDRSTTRNARCWLSNKYQIGHSLFGGSGGTRNSKGFSRKEQNLDFSNTGRHAQNWYYIGCIIPRTDNGHRSGITYYSGKD